MRGGARGRGDGSRGGVDALLDLLLTCWVPFRNLKAGMLCKNLTMYSTKKRRYKFIIPEQLVPSEISSYAAVILSVDRKMKSTENSLSLLEVGQLRDVTRSAGSI